MASRLQDVITLGTRALQPLATAVSPGTLYYVTDEGGIERSDGSAWAIYSGYPEKTVITTGDDSDSDNTLHSDPELLFPVVANAIYEFEMVLWITTGASNTPDFKFGFTLPAVATLSLYLSSFFDTATTGADTKLNSQYQLTTPTTALAVGVLTSASQVSSNAHIKGIVRTGGNTGNVQFQWAQNTTTGGTPTVRKKDSYIKYKRIG